jgi:hypothetical protein
MPVDLIGRYGDGDCNAANLKMKLRGQQGFTSSQMKMLEIVVFDTDMRVVNALRQGIELPFFSGEG